MAKIKGVAFKSTVDYLKTHLGEDGFAKLLERLTAEEAANFRTPLPGNWYELSLLVKLMKLAEGKVSLPPGRNLAWEIGRHIGGNHTRQHLQALLQGG